MNDAAMEEDGYNEAKPLIWWVADWRKPAKVSELAVHVRAVHVGRGGVRAGPIDVRGKTKGRYVFHAGNVAAAHVDKDVIRWTDHRVELRLDLNRSAGKHG